MKKITITSCPGYEEWRAQARACLQEGLPPHQLVWQDQRTEAQDLFASPAPHVKIDRIGFAVPRDFILMAEQAICHASPERFPLLYRVLWRLCHEDRKLLHHKTDDDILKLTSYVKAVRRDAYKIKAFLRFRAVHTEMGEHFIAWYEPEHYSLELSLPFFQTRFKNMMWSILTPYMSAHWDQTKLTLSDGVKREDAPDEDNIEKYWLKYYASTFNPARPKKSAMLNQMPKKYWKSMPETVLIADLLQTSHARALKMIDKGRQSAADNGAEKRDLTHTG